MKRQRHAAGQVVRRLGEGACMINAGKDLAGVLRHLGIAEPTWEHAGGTSTAGRRPRRPRRGKGWALECTGRYEPCSDARTGRSD